MGNHYIANGNNAHIDTMGFMEGLKERIVTELSLGTTDNIANFRASRRAEIYQYIYDDALSYSNSMPDKPSDDANVCRFLSPEKFLWLIDQKSILLSSPRSFDDDLDCALHGDFNDAILQCLPELLSKFSIELNPELICNEWGSFERRRRGDWLISCWTNLTNHKDDKLIWYKYANGPCGAGIMAKYRDLHEAIQSQIGPLSQNGVLSAGAVSYKPQVSKLLPFNKRNGFRGEQEVRFAIHGFEYERPVRVDLHDRFFELFDLRISEDSPQYHQKALTNLWIKAGGDPDGIEVG